MGHTSRKWILTFWAVAMFAAACGGDTAATGSDDPTAAPPSTAPSTQTTSAAASPEASAGEAAGDFESDLVKPGTLVFATTGNFPPFTFINEETGEVEGYSLDIGIVIAERLGLELETPTVDFVAELQGLASGLYDIADSAVSPTVERQSQFLFGPPFSSTGFIGSVLPEDAEEYSEGLADVEGLVLGAVAGSIRETWATENREELGWADLKTYPGAAELYLDLGAGRLDMAIEDSVLGAYFVAQNPEQATLVGEEILPHPQAAALRIDATNLHAAVSDVINEMIADGTLAEIQKEWFGKCLPTPDDINAEPPYSEPPGC